ncbi:MAG: glycerophosphodiester phosphodiesterase [Clostridium sp.]|nr:glycerophosphodiester phosphodiesterase [Clostridium sp.]
MRAERPTKIWAHRGASGHAPENTLPAFEMAYELGADGIELDAQLTKDGVPVVIHDETVDRVSDGTGPVRNFTLEELKKLNVGKNFPAYGKVQIPTLEEVYAFIKRTDMVVNLELKNSVFFYEGLEEKVLALAKRMGLSDRIIYSSFNHHSMKWVKELEPEAKIAFLYTDGIADVEEYGSKYGVYAVHPYMRNTEYPDMVKKCHERGIQVNVWTVNEEADIKRMKELGVDAIITNYAERG